MSQHVIINDLGRTLSKTHGFSLAGYILATRDNLIQKLGNPLPGKNTNHEPVNPLLRPTVSDVNDFWSIEFDEKTFVTIFDNAMTVNPDDWYVAVNSVSAVKLIETFLGLEVTPDHKNPIIPITETYPTYVKVEPQPPLDYTTVSKPQ